MYMFSKKLYLCTAFVLTPLKCQKIKEGNRK